MIMQVLCFANKLQNTRYTFAFEIIKSQYKTMNTRQKLSAMALLATVANIGIHAQIADSTGHAMEGEVDEVVITTTKSIKMNSSAMNVDLIGTAELCRAACCNLGESFTTNPSVDVNYSDAATGAKQIKLLGLSGTYVQMLTENVPNFRGAAIPYSLGYVPGPWMQSIQVSKGASSVKNGYESITGQINLEYQKPQLTDHLNVNLFASTMAKADFNLDAAVHLNSKWSTALLGHYEDDFDNHDSNGDGFQDLPKVRQAHLLNRWAYMSDHYVMQAAVSGLKETRHSGQITHGAHSAMSMGEGHSPYTIDISTDRYEAFVKNAYIINHEHNTNVAMILSGSLHNMDATYGNKRYDVDETNGYAQLMYETEFGEHNSISAGLSLNHDGFKSTVADSRSVSTAWLQTQSALDPDETVYGGYAQYTYRCEDHLTLMAGLRADHSSLWGSFVTPRTHIKWSPSDVVSIRASLGKGYRTARPLAENNYLLASSRNVLIGRLTQEEAWNYGLSTSLDIPLAGKTLRLNAEYFYTDFRHQTVIDLDTDPHAVYFSNLDGKSYSSVCQVDVTYPIVSGLTLTAAYRYTDAKTTYGGKLLERPLTSRYKGLVTMQYQTPLRFWTFDLTLLLNGGGRMPAAYLTTEQLGTNDGASSWASRFKSSQQLNAQITREFRNFSIYVGGENITGFRQKHPIVDASNPWGSNFDATMVWGPVHGAMYYVGMRFNLSKE